MDELNELRNTIDEIDRQIISLFKQRLDTAEQIAAVKKQLGSPIEHPGREMEVLKNAEKNCPKYSSEAHELMAFIMKISRNIQSKSINRD